jgi:AcrR family transcriptional regulator
MEPEFRFRKFGGTTAPFVKRNRWRPRMSRSTFMTIPETAPKPLRADARRNRQRVLEAARECFAREGMQAQIDEIAAGAEVGVGTVYRHFPTKEALLDALAADYFAHQAQAAREALAVEDPWEAFHGRPASGLPARGCARDHVLSGLAADQPGRVRELAAGARVRARRAARSRLG